MRILAQLFHRRPAFAALVLAAALAVAAAGMAWPRLERFFTDRTEAAAEATLALTLEVLRGELDRAAPLPALLAERPILSALLADPDNQGIAPFANEQLRQTAIRLGVSDIYLMDVNGTAIAASNYRLDRTFIGRNFAYRLYFTEAISGNPGRFHALGTTSLQRGYFFAAPLLIDTEITGVIAVKITLEDVESSWAEGPVEVVVTDQNNVVFLSSREDWRFRSLGGMPDGARETIVATRQYPLERVRPLSLDMSDSRVQLDGENFISATGLVASAGWRVRVLAPDTPALQQARLATAVLVLIVLSLGLVAALFLQRRARLLERLEVQAQARALLEARVNERTAQLRQEVEDRRAAENELRRTQSELVQAGKLAALGQMSAALSHEFNQPLAAVKAYADNAGTFLDRDQPEAAARNIGLISQMADRMAAISKHLRNFARKPEDKTGPIPLIATLDEAIAVMSPKLTDCGGEIRFDRPEAEIWVTGGRVRLSQVIVNLISNALDAMEGRPEKPIEISVQPMAARWRIDVRDHGPGLPEGMADQIFDPFFSTKGPAGAGGAGMGGAGTGGAGMGLGLSISYNIMRDFGGGLSAVNHETGGAVFSVDVQGADAARMVAE